MNLAAGGSNAIWFSYLGYVACSLVLLTFIMTSMRMLRLVAISSNIAFITYATVGHLYPILILHAIMLPMNLYRLFQLQQSHHKPLIPPTAATAD